MKVKLKSEWRFKDQIEVFYDRAPKSFHRLGVEDVHTFLSTQQFNEFNPPLTLENTTMLTERDGGIIDYKVTRPALLVTSTSFTEDEDLTILLDAMEMYDQDWNATMPELVMIITGKGPLQEMYRVKIGELVLKRVTIRMMWLKIDDYPKLLGSVDLGLSFHSSSSGLDLPMKIVDLFGCGTPVLALDYPCISELVKDGVNGLLFTDAQSLYNHLKNLLTGFPNSELQLMDTLRDGVKQSQDTCWDQHWNEHALKYFKD